MPPPGPCDIPRVLAVYCFVHEVTGVAHLNLSTTPGLAACLEKVSVKLRSCERSRRDTLAFHHCREPWEPQTLAYAVIVLVDSRHCAIWSAPCDDNRLRDPIYTEQMAWESYPIRAQLVAIAKLYSELRRSCRVNQRGLFLVRMPSDV